MKKKSIILLVEPEENIRESIEMILVDEGYDCYATGQSETLLHAVSIHKPDLIIADLRPLSVHVEEILQALHHYISAPPILVTLSYEQLYDMTYLMEFNITEYLVKPFHFDEMLERVQKMLKPR